MNFYISDPHFFHENIIHLCHRPFRDVEEMNNVMADNWNRVVGPDDDVYIVGDFGYKATSQELIKMIKSLNGHKHLIMGNHDRKALNDPEYRACYEDISDIKEVVDNGVRIVLCHYPIVEWNNFYRESWHFFGHIHNANSMAQSIMANIPKAVNIGAEYLDYTPRTAKYLMDTRNRLPYTLW